MIRNDGKLVESPQWREGRFRNQTPWEWMSAGDYLGMMYEYIFRSRDGSPKATLPSQPVDLSYYRSSSANQLSATWLGHSSVMLNVDGVRILTDPVLVRNMTVLGPWRYSGNAPISPSEIPETDILVISHNHFDHLNEHTLKGIHDKVGRVVTPIGVGKDIRRCGFATEKIIELDWWDVHTDATGTRITATPAQHFSGRRLTDRDKSLWASFVIEGEHHRVFFGGDSGYFDGFAAIGDRWSSFDMTFLETGAYSRFWHAVHMFPEETVQAHCDLRGSILHPIHWGTFDLSLHTWYDPMRRLVADAKKKGVRYTVPVAGATTVYDQLVHTDEWWEGVLRKEGKD